MKTQASLFNKLIISTFLAATFFTAANGEGAISTTASAPRKVTDYYLLLPSDLSEIVGGENPGAGFRTGFFFNEDADRKSSGARDRYRRSLIKVEDTANGYLKIQGAGWSGWNEIALFKKVDGSYVVAVSQVADEPPLTGDVMFLTLENGKWTNVTQEVFSPDSLSATHLYKLPRTGTTITAVCTESAGYGCTPRAVLASYYWTKEKFTK